jgi:two-component system, NarL family, nitrate/nitrite response regulator NarL
MSSLNVLLAIEVPFYREGLQQLLSRTVEINVVDAVPGEHVVAAVVSTAASLVLLDISPPNAHRWLKQMRSLERPPRVVALAVDDNRESILSWIEAGISGYVTKNSTSSELIQALYTAARGEWSCSQHIVSGVMERLSTLAANNRAVAPIADVLTSREQQILGLVGQGLSNKRIAIALRISHATAKNHVHHILSKLQLHNRAQVGAYLRRCEDSANDFRGVATGTSVNTARGQIVSR